MSRTPQRIFSSPYTFNSCAAAKRCFIVTSTRAAHRKSQPHCLAWMSFVAPLTVLTEGRTVLFPCCPLEGVEQCDRSERITGANGDRTRGSTRVRTYPSIAREKRGVYQKELVIRRHPLRHFAPAPPISEGEPSGGVHSSRLAAAAPAARPPRHQLGCPLQLTAH